MPEYIVTSHTYMTITVEADDEDDAGEVAEAHFMSTMETQPEGVDIDYSGRFYVDAVEQNDTD